MLCRGTAEVIRGGNNRVEEARRSNRCFLAAWPKLLTMKVSASPGNKGEGVRRIVSVYVSS